MGPNAPRGVWFGFPGPLWKNVPATFFVLPDCCRKVIHSLPKDLQTHRAAAIMRRWSCVRNCHRIPPPFLPGERLVPDKKKKLVIGWACVFLGLVLLLLLFSIGCVLVMFGPPFEVLGPGFDPTGSVRLFTWSTFFLLLIPWVWLVRWCKTGK